LQIASGTFSGDVNISGNVTIGGILTGGSPLHVSGGLVVTGSDGGVIYIGSGSTSTFSGSTIFSGSTTVTGSLTVTGSETIYNYGSYVNYLSDTSRGFFIQESDGLVSGSGNFKIGGSVSASSDVYVTGAVSASLFIGDGTGITGVSATNISGANGQFNTANGNLIVTGTMEMNGFVVDSDGDTNLKSLRVDDGSFIGCDSDTDLMRLSTNVVQVNGTVSGSNNLQFSSASFNGDVSVSGTVRGKMIQLTNHAYNISGGGERWIPFYNISDLNFTSHDFTGQVVTPFSGRLRSVIFRPGASDCGSTKITLYKQTNGTENMQSSRTYVEEQTVTCTAAAATSNVFNFTGSGHFSAGEVIGVAIDPTNGPDNANVTCVWEYDIFGV